MTNDNRRITLIARHPNAPSRDWDESNPKSRLILVDAVSFLRYAIDRGVNELGEDVERVIIDRTGTALQYLDALASLPGQFFGDVLFVLTNGHGFLSSAGRGGDRVLYALTERDVDFYLQTNHLVWATEGASVAHQEVTFRNIASRSANS
jgi:hypothetical protein